MNNQNGETAQEYKDRVLEPLYCELDGLLEDKDDNNNPRIPQLEQSIMASENVFFALAKAELKVRG